MLTHRRIPLGISLFLPALAALWWGACGLPDSATNACTDTVDDCGGMPGTFCEEDQCLCPDIGQQWCKGACRAIAHCRPDAGSGSGGAGGAGGAPGTECQVDSDCDLPDPRCGTAECENGFCERQIKAGPIDSQIKGDCTLVECDTMGNVTLKIDNNDAYNDGRQCTIDYCKTDNMSQAIVVNQHHANGGICPETNEGVCFEGDCVDCIQNLAPFCGGSLACDYTTCVPMTCTNGVFDKALGETDFNCGGPCRPCQTGQLCAIDSDCIHGVCKGGSCKMPSCSDGVTNDGETDIDCGGPPSCARCAPGKACDFGTDCESQACWVGKCEAPACDDGLMNGDEKGLDCGGSCAACP